MKAPAGETLSDSLIDALREAIQTGRYRPGARLVQDDLAHEYGTSRIPLREALRRLEGEGLVSIAANRGAVVRPLETKDVADLYDVRIALESLAVRRAAERFVDVRPTTTRLADAARGAIDRNERADLFRFDRDFHAELALASANEHLIATLGAQWSQIVRVMHAYLTTTRYPDAVWHEHDAIARHVAIGHADAAVEHVTYHLTVSRDRILANLRDGGT
jgi:DNA-binding GntR family transcriptional regulator